MPGKVRVKIIAGRNLPVMDRGSDTTDAYVEIKLANTTYKTDVYRKSLNPQWNSDFYRFEVSSFCVPIMATVLTDQFIVALYSSMMPSYKMNHYKSGSWTTTPIRLTMLLEK